MNNNLNDPHDWLFAARLFVLFGLVSGADFLSLLLPVHHSLSLGILQFPLGLALLHIYRTGYGWALVWLGLSVVRELTAIGFFGLSGMPSEESLVPLFAVIGAILLPAVSIWESYRLTQPKVEKNKAAFPGQRKEGHTVA